MGGHGGLNILPQKSWNVYGRENRERVARDEAAAAEAAAASAAASAAADAEARRRVLLARAERRYRDAGLPLPPSPGRADSGAHEEEQQQPQQPPEAAPPADERRRKRRRRGDAPGAPPAPAPPRGLAALAAQLRAEPPPPEAEARPGAAPAPHRQQPPRHVNLFEAEERAAGDARGGHPEVERARRAKERARGKKDTRTSDARFDESFRFAHRLGGGAGGAGVPWYARAAQQPAAEAPAPAADVEGWRRAAAEALAAPRPLLGGVVVVPAAGGGEPSSGSDGGKRRGRRRGKDKGRRRSRSRSRSRSRDRDRGRNRGGDGSPSIEALRQERLEREEAERRRAEAVLRAASGRGEEPAGGRRFYQGYGYGRR